MQIKRVTKMLSAVLSAAMLITSVPAAFLAETVESAGVGEKAREENLLKIWFDEPVSQGTVRSGMQGGQGTTAPDNIWQQLTLPIGNSMMGANIYGEIAEEHLTFNQKTLWNGGPSESRPNYNGGNKQNMADTYQRVVDLFLAGEDSAASSLCDSLTGESAGYGAYQSWGDIYLKFDGLSSSTDYRRDLDLTTGMANVDFTANGTDYHREYFISHPDNVLAMKLTADGSSKLNMNVKFLVDNGETDDETTSNLNRKLGKENVSYTVNAQEGTIVTKGQMQDNQMQMNSMLKVQTQGTVTKNADGQSLDVANADEVVIFISADTDYKNDYPSYRTGETPEELAESVAQTVTAAAEKGYSEVQKSHLKDYQELFGRVNLDLGQSATDKTTDALLTAYNATGNGAASDTEKRLLEVILYQYGRYLTIASSREGDLPSNLQGVWQNRVGDHTRVAWGCDYHMNVNLQMNYWPTYSANLAECATPLIDYVDSLREPGRVTAESYYGIKSETGEANGFTAHTQNTPFGWTCPGWAFSWGWSPAAVPWIIQNCWEHYEYTGDVQYMKEHIYPMLKEEAILYDQILVDSGVKITLADGTESTRLVSAPTYSPEMGIRTLGNAYEQVLIWQLYEDAITAAKTLGVDSDLAAQWKKNQDRLAPIEIGDSGQIKEWYNETTLGQTTTGPVTGYEAGHRHMSHLLGVFPGDLVSVENKEYMDAAIVSLENRGYNSTGWAMGQRINAWARTGDGEKAHLLIRNLFSGGIYPNLWDSHAPFQIDGNFGYTSGVNEMLMQSNVGYINILPAIPEIWSEGSVDGILARGNFEIGIEWQEGKATSVEIESKNGGECVVQCKGIKGSNVTVKDSGNNVITVTPDADAEKDRISFETTKGETYTITGFDEGIEEKEKLAAPTNAAANVSANGVTLTWNAVNGADYYNVYRKVNTDFVKINTSNVSGTTYTDADALELDEDARYRIAAVKDGEEGLHSAIVIANITNIQKQVTITFRSEETIDGGTLPAAVQKMSGDSYTLPECNATVTGYQFAGWNDGKRTYTANSSYTVPRKDMTLTAVWEADAYDKLDKTGWSATAGSEQNSGNDGPARNAIDDNETNWWHSNYSDNSKKPVIADPGERNEFTIDFGKTISADKFEYVPRTEGNGFITGYRLYYSTTADGDDFIEIGDGGTWAYNSMKKSVLFGKAISMRRIQIRATETNGSEGLNKHITAAEFNLYTLKDGIISPTAINADTEMTLNIGESKKIAASVIPANATYKEITYKSSNSQIASVSADGTVTAGSKTGTAEITMTAFGNITAVCTVTVISNIEVESISLEKESVTLQPGGEVALIVNIQPYYGVDRTVTWQSDNEEVATVDNGMVTAVGYGNAAITATASNGLTAACEIWVVKRSEESGDKTELSAKLEELDGKDVSGYTEESMKEYFDALEKAQKVLGSKNPSQPEINAALERLKNAVDGLKEKASTEKLDALKKKIEEAEKKDLSSYTAESAAAVTNALSEAKKLLNTDASNADIDQALKDLESALQKLVPLSGKGTEPSVPGLNTLIEDANLQYRVTKSDAVNGTAAVTAVTAAGKKKGTITIPATVEKDGYTFKVTVINKNVFKGCKKKLKSVIIGANVTEIGATCFNKCSKLKSIRFMGTVAPKKAGKNAFKGIKSTCKIFYPKSMSKSELKKLKKIMKSAGKKVVYKKK